MKLKPIPANTVVHTPTEAEAKELLAILHENGYKLWNGHNLLVLSDGFARRMNAIIIRPAQGVVDWYDSIDNAPESITLAEFKRLYCEEEKPRPKFNKGDKVYQTSVTDRLVEYTVKKVYMDRRGNYIYDLQGLIGIIGVEENDLCFTNQNPYTKLETNPTEDMETKDETKELNLCKLLQGHEGESIFLTTMGDVLVEKVSEEHLFFRLRAPGPGWRLNANGKMNKNGVVITYPSRALYEQYPLDATKAWSVWQEEQEKKHYQDYSNRVGCEIVRPLLDKVLPSDRDKCIEEIKAIIEKYSAK